MKRALMFTIGALLSASAALAQVAGDDVALAFAPARTWFRPARPFN